MSKSKEALALLDDLDSFTAVPAPAPSALGHKSKSKPSSVSSIAGKPPVNDKDAADALAFIDEITQKSAEPRKSMSSLPTSTTRVTLSGSRPGTPGAGGSGLRKSVDVPRVSPKPQDAAPAASTGAAASGGAWGWGSVWNTASAALAQAKETVDAQVKNLPQIPQNDQAKKWAEGAITYVKQAQLDKLGTFSRGMVGSARDRLAVSCSPGPQDDVVVDSHRTDECGRSADCRTRGHRGDPVARYGRIRWCRVARVPSTRQGKSALTLGGCALTVLDTCRSSSKWKVAT